MSLTRADVIAYLERLTAAELDEFIAELQERLQLRPVVTQSFVTMGAMPTMGMPLERELTLVGFGADKIAVIRAVRELWPLGLMEAKKLVESAPVVLREGLEPGDARDIAAVLRRAGAIVEVS
jgi:large subunit ribosomal protein L7/L12